LQALNAGESTEEAAFAKISEAKILTDRVRDIFAQLGDTRENKAFARRYAAIFTPPLNASPEFEKWRQELQVAMSELETMLAADFRTEAIA
jgi:viroplasmin and RNaseH domain-containing protein